MNYNYNFVKIFNVEQRQGQGQPWQEQKVNITLPSLLEGPELPLHKMKFYWFCKKNLTEQSSAYCLAQSFWWSLSGNTVLEQRFIIQKSCAEQYIKIDNLSKKWTSDQIPTEKHSHCRLCSDQHAKTGKWPQAYD